MAEADSNPVVHESADQKNKQSSRNSAALFFITKGIPYRSNSSSSPHEIVQVAPKFIAPVFSISFFHQLIESRSVPAPERILSMNDIYGFLVWVNPEIPVKFLFAQYRIENLPTDKRCTTPTESCSVQILRANSYPPLIRCNL